MNRNIAFVVVATALVAGRAWAQEPSAGQNSTEDELAAEQLEDVEWQARLDELMEIMFEEMTVIRDTEERDDREALMAEHREHMREAMSLMHGMGGDRMRELMSSHMDAELTPAEPASRPAHLHRRARPAQPRAGISIAQRLTDLENRMDMMQIMMESLLDEYAGP